MKRISTIILILILAYPVDFVFLLYSTARLIMAGFGIKEAFRYSLNRGGL